jgi:hypothetical protein
MFNGLPIISIIGILTLRVPDCSREFNADRPAKRTERKSEGVEKEISPHKHFGISSRAER